MLLLLLLRLLRLLLGLLMIVSIRCLVVIVVEVVVITIVVVVTGLATSIRMLRSKLNYLSEHGLSRFDSLSGSFDSYFAIVTG